MSATDQMQEVDAAEAVQRERREVMSRLDQLEERIKALDNLQFSPDSEGVVRGNMDSGGKVLELHPQAAPAASGGGGGGAGAWRLLTHSISVSGLLPTTTEINTALTATYTDPAPDLVPADFDIVVLTVSSVPKFIALVTTQVATASGSFVRSFVVNTVTYYALLWQTGVY